MCAGVGVGVGVGVQLAEAAIGAAERKLADLDVQGGEAAREEARACFSEAHAVFGAVEPEHLDKLAFLDQACTSSVRPHALVASGRMH